MLVSMAGLRFKRTEGDKMTSLSSRRGCTETTCSCQPGPGPHGPRRQFLQALGGLGAASVLPSCTMMTSTPAAAPRIVDTHHHFYAPEYQEAWLAWEDKRSIPHFPTQASWSRSKSLEEMDQSNVRTAILSVPSTP